MKVIITVEALIYVMSAPFFFFNVLFYVDVTTIRFLFPTSPVACGLFSDAVDTGCSVNNDREECRRNGRGLVCCRIPDICVQ